MADSAGGDAMGAGHGQGQAHGSDRPVTRVERDSLGEVEVPNDAMYGAQTQRAVDNFPVSGQRVDRRVVRALGLVKGSAARANAELELVASDVADAVARAADEVREGSWDDQFVVDVYQTGSGTSSNMNANEVIARRAQELRSGEEPAVHPNDHVNFGQSSNDVFPTAIHVASRIALEREVFPAVEALRDGLADKAEALDHVVKSGRTHLMDATPVRLGQEFAGYAHQLTRGLERLRAASEELAELPLGGTATGTGINTHPEFPRRAIAHISETTRIPFREAENHFEAQGARDGLVAAHGAFNTLAGSLFKIADDIRWLASGPTSGLREIRLPAVQPGSSIMPGKVNPVLAESLMMACVRVQGNQTALTVGGGRGNFELNVMMPVMAQAFLESATVLAGACRAFLDRCVRGIQADEARCQELLELNPSIATALNTKIGYDRASEVAKRSGHEGRSVRDIVLEEGLLSEAELDEALDVRDMTEPGFPGKGEGRS